MPYQILLVDDESIVVDYVAKHLRESGYVVVTALTAEAALTLIEKNLCVPHLLITDLVLPGMSGFALADALRLSKPDLKTLFISGYTGAEYFRQMGVVSDEIPFLQKPLALDEFLRKVAQLLSTVSQGANSAEQ